MDLHSGGSVLFHLCVKKDILLVVCRAGPVWFLDADVKFLLVAPVFKASGVCLGSSWLSLGLYLQLAEL